MERGSEASKFATGRAGGFDLELSFGTVVGMGWAWDGHDLGQERKHGNGHGGETRLYVFIRNIASE